MVSKIERATTYRLGKTKNYATVIGEYKPKKQIDLLTKGKNDAYATGTKGKGSLVIREVHVNKKLRNKGVGKYIVNKLIRDTKAKEVYADRVKKSAHGFWNKMGFKIYGDVAKKGR
jgi:GNAT superfamily N-acetyltransferase